MSILSFKKFSPSLTLQPFVKFLYHIEVNQKGQSFSSATLNHPQGGIDLIIVMNGKLGLKSGDKDQGDEKDVLLIGQQNQFFSFSFEPNTELYGVVFYPQGAHRWLNISIDESTNTVRSLMDKEINGDLEQLKGRLFEAREPNRAIQIFDAWLLQNLSDQSYSSLQLDRGLKHIHQSKISPTIDDMAAMFNVSKRSLQRNFKRFYGISPKQYLDVLRFNRLMLALQYSAHPDLSKLMQAAGYYDQSHFIKVFQKMTGNTPGEFISQKPPLAEYFLHL